MQNVKEYNPVHRQSQKYTGFKVQIVLLQFLALLFRGIPRIHLKNLI